ncbi:MAG TPA: prolipoprotein diacylglyceryl transferase, partial [Bdellovibrionales bacterium]|nr:prolipoprotein diacylglyceryl transferase [Bdellovibrionales bacterium]
MTNSSAWVHNLDPFLIQLSGSLGIRWYGMAYLAAFVVGAMIMIFLAKRGRRTISPDQVTDYITYCVLGTMIGGRLGYAVFYSPDLLTDFSPTTIFGHEIPFWGVLKVWEGGMASHGGMIGVFCAALLFARRHKLDWRHLGDLTVLGGSVGFFFGRIANFINGELFGRAASPDVKWAVKFPSETFLWLQHDKGLSIPEFEGQTNLLSKLSETVQKAGVNIEQWNAWLSEVRTSGNARYQIQTVLNNIVDQIQNGNEALRETLGQVLTPRHPSQLYAALLEGLLLFLVT